MLSKFWTIFCNKFSSNVTIFSKLLKFLHKYADISNVRLKVYYMDNKETLKLGIGYILNFAKNSKELSPEDMMDDASSKLFSVFAGSDNKLDIKEKENLWEVAKQYASSNKTGKLEDDNILDEKELKAFIDATINDTDLKNKITLKDFTNFLMKVFQKPETVKLEDNLHLKREFTVLNKDKETEYYAENMFNPDNLPTIDEYQDDDKKILKCKILNDKDGKPQRILNYDQYGKVSNVEIKTDNGWKRIKGIGYIINEIYYLTEDKTKTLKYQEVKNGKLYTEIQYDSENSKYYKKTTYFDNGKIKDVKEYHNKKLTSAMHYNEYGTYKGKETCVYDEEGLAEVKIYNEKDELAIVENCIKNEKRDNNGNIISGPIFYPDSDKYMMSDYIVNSLVDNFNTNTLKLLDEDTIMRTISKFEIAVKSDKPEEYNLFLKIKSNPDKNIVKEQLDTVINVLKTTVKNEYGTKWSPEIAQKFNNMLDELYSDNITPSKVEKIENILVTEYMLTKGMSFINDTNINTPNGIIDKVSYQGQTGDCWLLASLFSLSELKGAKEYLNKFIKNDPQKQTVTVYLNNGKNKYTFTYEDIKSSIMLSVGDYDMRALEMAFEKYAQEYGINKKETINGGEEQYAFQLLEGKKTQKAEIRDNKIGIIVNDKFIEINKENKNILKYIPITIEPPINENIFEQLKDIQETTAMTTASYGGISGHAYYINEISDDNNITIKEPHNPNNSRTYDIKSYNDIYKGDITIFIV